MSHWIKTEGEIIKVVYFTEHPDTVKVELPEGFLESDFANEYRFINGQIVEHGHIDS